ncbi:hypothetical protein G3O07_00930 [Pseudomonas laurentiana]|uniref:Glycine zipper 2TM domain-containing protein n=1 Tax=Pseudomonas laurentiana TaxID=2364649 RepID=A0A6I5RKL3_9PSED|nr:hypothetical protein [Pseudomonas laurentiana]
MSTLNTFNAIVGLVCGLTLSACAELYPPNNTSTPIYNSPEVTQTTSAYSGRGVVQSIVPANQGYQGLAGTGYGLGTLIGALAGGLAGSQVGSGTGKTVAMVAGTAGAPTLDTNWNSVISNLPATRLPSAWTTAPTRP